jgi:spore coat polysaccharide biosynthesis predicted glycosyltransferase SpsG
MILYEAITSGVPVLANPQLYDMKSEVNWFAERGACCNIEAIAWDSFELVNKINDFLSDTKSAGLMSLRQRELLDGLGIKRVSRIIEDLLFETAIDK